MKVQNFAPFLLLIWINSARAEKQHYEGTAVVRLHVDRQLMNIVDALVRKHPQLDEWGRHFPPQRNMKNLSMDIMVQREARNEFWALVHEKQISHDIIIPDVYRLVEEQRRARKSRTSPTLRHILTLDNHHPNLVGRYPRFQEIMEWLYRLAGERPDFVTVIDIGTSTENRQIRVLKISTAPRGYHRQSIWIDAAIHAREWIGPAAAIYMIDQLVHQYGRDANITSLVDNYDWYFLPIANPDGYEFSHTHNRLWRKTRSRHGSFTGVDLNRNFNFHWINCSEFSDLTPVECFDNHPAYDVYGGPRPLSEPESVAMARFLLDNGSKFLFYFSLHAYAQLWLVPWAHSHVLADDFVEMMMLAEIGSKALGNEYGTTYIRGPPAIILYQAGGTTMDWAKGVAGIKYCYILELRDTGRFGFLLPESEILPTAKETMKGIGAVLQAYADPRRRAEIFDQSRGKRKVTTLQRYKKYLEKHVSYWGGVNRSYTLDEEDVDEGFEEYFNSFKEQPDNNMSWLLGSNR